MSTNNIVTLVKQTYVIREIELGWMGICYLIDVLLTFCMYSTVSSINL